METEQKTPIDAAMGLANLGNYSGAIKLLTQNTPATSVIHQNKYLFDNYYPKESANLLSTRVNHPAQDPSGEIPNYSTNRLKKL
eukprot:14651664-Ditylum_brightwellii.AAC.1